MERSSRSRLLSIDEVSQAFLKLLVAWGGDCTVEQRKSLQRPRPAVHAVRVSWPSDAPWSVTCRPAPRNTTPSRAVAATIRWKVCFWSRNGARRSPTSEARPSEGRQISAAICHPTRGCEPPLYHSITGPPRGGALTLAIGEGDALPDSSRVARRGRLPRPLLVAVGPQDTHPWRKNSAGHRVRLSYGEGALRRPGHFCRADGHSHG